MLKSLSHNAHRLSLEWSRIEPAPGEFSRGALAHYRGVLTALADTLWKRVGRVLLRAHQAAVQAVHGVSSQSSIGLALLIVRASSMPSPQSPR